MAEDLENKIQKNKKINNDDKDSKTISSNKPEVDPVSQTKTKELKNTSDLDDKKVKQVLSHLLKIKKFLQKKNLLKNLMI